MEECKSGPTEARLLGSQRDDGYARTGNGRRRDDSSRAPRSSGRQTVAEAAIKSVVRSVGSSLGRALVRGILGSLKKGF